MFPNFTKWDSLNFSNRAHALNDNLALSFAELRFCLTYHLNFFGGNEHNFTIHPHGNPVSGALVLKQRLADGETQGFFNRLALNDGNLLPGWVFCCYPAASRNRRHKSSR